MSSELVNQIKPSKFVVNDIKLLSSWGYNLPSNVDCTICRCSLNSSSLYHQDKGFDSYIVEGTCGHSYHHECIKPWADKNKHCPICSAPWVYKNTLEPNIVTNHKTKTKNNID
jgi:hypothetical protein